MINSSGTNPMKYIMGMHALLSKMTGNEAEAKAGVATRSKDLTEYTGFYDKGPWSGEEYIGTWNGNLVVLNLPSDKPAESLTRFRPVGGDTFRRIREDGELGETLVFERNAEGKITRYQQQGNYTRRIIR